MISLQVLQITLQGDCSISCACVKVMTAVVHDIVTDSEWGTIVG